MTETPTESVNRIVEGELTAISIEGVQTYRFEADKDTEAEPFTLVMNTTGPRDNNFALQKPRRARVAVQLEWTD